MNNKTILYIHGMGGGPHDGVRSGLEERTSGKIYHDNNGNEYTITVYSHLYSFDPVKGHQQILSWVQKYKPDLIVAISLGAFHALDILNIPHIYLCPAFNAENAISMVEEMIEKDPSLRQVLEAQFSQTRNGCQKLTADPSVLKPYGKLSDDIFAKKDQIRKVKAYGFFGSDDDYIKIGVVSPKLWRNLYGDDTYTVIKGADHNFSGYDIVGDLIPKVLEFLGLKVVRYSPTLCI